ncbi:MAG: hypothetical protein M3N29_02060, partial [Chloroflexota bacterium]|nr:hypothetical protein [Chloroflexota bacterium]
VSASPAGATASPRADAADAASAQVPSRRAPAETTRRGSAAGDPTRAAVAAQSADELWFLAPTAGARVSEGGDQADGQSSMLVTLFWTVATGVAVVAVVLIFLQLFTNLLR